MIIVIKKYVIHFCYALSVIKLKIQNEFQEFSLYF